MKLWILTNNTVIGYDTYDSCIVAAETEQEARMFHPDGTKASFNPNTVDYSWCKRLEDVQVEYLGATDRDISGVILASFNAG